MRKLLVVGVIVLFLGLACAPSINANVSEENKPLDNGEVEIISYINGYADMWSYQGGLLIHLQLDIWVGDWDIKIKAFTKNLSNPVYHAKPTMYIYVPLFMGITIGYETHGRINGIALGNIEWN